MAFKEQVTSLEAEISGAGVTVDAVLTKAGLDRATWTRWKAGTFSPRMTNWLKVQEAARELIRAAA